MKRISNILSILLLAITFNVASLYAAPSTQAKSIAFSNITSTSATITWINGNGGHRIVVLYNDDLDQEEPTNGTSYTASTIYGAGQQISNGNTLGYVVYNGTGSTRSVSVTGLTAGTEYYARVYESNNIPTNLNFNTNTALNNPRAFKTSIAVPTGLVTNSFDANNANVSWTSVMGATGYVFDMTTNGNDIADYNDVDLGDVISYDITNLTENTPYSWTVAAYNNDDQSTFANRVTFTTLNDITPPTFTVDYYYDNNYTMPLYTQDGVVGEGTYYLMVTSSEPLVSTPTVTIAAAGGTINDRSSVATNQISNTSFAYTRVVDFDENSDNGMSFEMISVTGNDGNGNIGTTNDLEGLKIDTKAPEFDAIGLADNYTLSIDFTEAVRDASSLFDQSTGDDTHIPLSVDNFVVTLEDADQSGVSDVTVESIEEVSPMSYILTLSYTTTDDFGAPYQGTPAITVAMVNTEDLYENEFDENYTSSKFDLALTPILNETSNIYYETLEVAVDEASDEDHLLFAPTDIFVFGAITTSTSLTFDGYDASNIFLAEDITFENTDVSFIGTEYLGDSGNYTITEDVAGASLEFINSNVMLENITLDADVNTNGTDVNTLNGIYLTVNSNISITGNTTTLSTSTFNTADGIALAVSSANATLTELEFMNNETAVSYSGGESYLLDINAGYFYNASSTGILVDNSNANIYNFPTFEDNATAIKVSGELGYLTMYESDVINNGTGVWVDNSNVTVENINFYDNTTAINVNTTFDITVNISEFTGNGVAINVDAASSINVSDNIFDSQEVALQNNTATIANAVSNYYGSNLGPNVEGNQCGDGASITGLATWEPWYVSVDLVTRASTVKNNTIETSTPEYCAYEGSEVDFTGSMHTGGLLDGDDNSIDFTYTWYVNDVEVDNSDVQSLTGHLLDVAGTYTIRRDVTSNGCTYESNEVEVIVNELPNIPTLSAESTFCYGTENEISITNVQMGVTYQWYDMNGELVGETGETLTVDEDGTFYVEATNLEGCMVASEEITVDELPELFLTINNGDEEYISCSDEIEELTSQVSDAENSNFTYSYEWMLNGNTVGTDATYTPTESGIYTLVTTDETNGIGCSVSDDISVTINPLPTVPVISGDMTACYNGPVTLEVTNYDASDIDGDDDFNLTWYDSEGNWAGEGLTYVVDFADIAETSASYYVVATNDVTFCDVESAGFPSSYTVNELPEFFVNVENVDYCSNATAVSLEAVVTGGTNGDMYSYEWFNEMNESVGTGSTYMYPNSTPGEYTYYVKATLVGEGCEATSNNATVKIYELAEPVISGDNALTNETDRVCEGQDFTFTVTNNNMNGEAEADSYQWYFEGEMVGTDSPTLEITNAMLDQAGAYTVEITTIHGCTTESAEFNLDVTPLAEVTGLTFTTNGTTSANLTQGQQTDFREDLDITYTVTATDAVSYRWWFEGLELDETSNELTLTYETIDMLDGLADNMYEGTDIFANPINTFTVQAEAVSAEECVNDYSVSVELNVVPVPTWIEIVAIPTRTDGNPANDIDIPSNNTEFMVTVRAKNNLDFLSNVIADTRLTLSLNGGTLVTSEFNDGDPIVLANGTNSVSFPVVLTKTIGEVGLTLQAIVDDANTENDLMDNLKGSDDGVQNMMTDYATSNEFVLIPTKPDAPTTPTRVSRSRTTLTLRSTITNPPGTTLYSLIAGKQTAVNPTNDLTPEDGQAFVAHATLGNVTADIIGDGYQAIYFGSARQVTMAGLTKSTKYSIKYYAVAGDFIAAKTATYRYSDNLKHDNVATSNKESDEVEFVSESDAPFTVSAIFPNPVKDVLNFNVTNTEAANYKVEVMTATGQIVSVPFTDLQLAAGTSSHNFNLEGVAAGSYMLIVTSGDHAYVVPFVVMP